MEKGQWNGTSDEIWRRMKEGEWNKKWMMEEK